MAENEDYVILDMLKDPGSASHGFSKLVAVYQEKVYWLIRRMVIDHDDTDDLVQETFLKVWKNIGKFKGESSLFTWIYRIATNEALGFIKAKKRKFIFSLIGFEDHYLKKINDDSFFTGDEIQKKLQKAILSLPEKQRLVFNMKYYEEVKYEEMSEILGTSVGALKASYHHAVKKIEKFVTSH